MGNHWKKKSQLFIFKIVVLASVLLSSLKLLTAFFLEVPRYSSSILKKPPNISL